MPKKQEQKVCQNCGIEFTSTTYSESERQEIIEWEQQGILYCWKCAFIPKYAKKHRKKELIHVSGQKIR